MMFESRTNRLMNKLAPLLMLVALSLPTLAMAQPEGPPRERGDRDRSQQRDPGDRPGRDRQADQPSDRKGPSRQSFGKREPITVEQIDQAVATLREMHPETQLPWLDRIETLAEENPEEAARRLSRFPRLRELMEAREKRPAEFELNAQQSRLMREVFPLVRKAREAEKNQDQAALDDIRTKLRQRIESLFQVRLKLKELEIQRIREQLQRAEKDLADIKADGDKLIDEKLKEMMHRGDGPRGPRGEKTDLPER